MAEKTAKGLILLLMLGIIGCGNPYKKFISKTDDGKVKINYERFTDAFYMDRRLITENGVGKPDSGLENQLRAFSMMASGSSIGFVDYELDKDVKAGWRINNKNFIVFCRKKDVSPIMDPKDGLCECFIVPATEKNERVFYAFIDKDLKEKEFHVYPFFEGESYPNNLPEPKFRSIGKGVYMAKFKPIERNGRSAPSYSVSGEEYSICIADNPDYIWSKK